MKYRRTWIVVVLLASASLCATASPPFVEALRELPGTVGSIFANSLLSKSTEILKEARATAGTVEEMSGDLKEIMDQGHMLLGELDKSVGTNQMMLGIQLVLTAVNILLLIVSLVRSRRSKAKVTWSQREEE